MSLTQSKPFLRVPPFPGARATGFIRRPAARGALTDDRIDQLIQSVRQSRVGSDYWADQPDMPAKSYVLLRTADPQRGLELARRVAAGRPIVVWAGPCEGSSKEPGTWSVSGQVDPWHLLRDATHAIVDAGDELALIAAIADVPLACIGDGPYSELGCENGNRVTLRRLFHDSVGGQYVDPFSEEPIEAVEVIRLCAFWRELIDSNRPIRAAIGFAFWKRPTVEPLLWGGSSDVPFASTIGVKEQGCSVAVWKSRAPRSALEELARGDLSVVEVEDGFIRSVGLGADCLPPLSIVADPLGIYFDPARPSLLEQLIQAGPFTPGLLQRARELRELIVSSGISKYGAGPSAPLRRRSERRHILVPGQVEDDRAVLCGGGDVKGNLDLLHRVRHGAPNAYIIYKPHPDVEAGHRKGAIADRDCLALADEIVRDGAMPSLIGLADEVHVNTSLTGFEALLRAKPVTTYGVPFYAGWGLTRDHGSIPARRSTRRTLDELVAAALLLYPRYLDPVTGLPCPPEVLIRRIAEGNAQSGGVVVKLRRMHGRWRKRLAGLGEGAR